MAAGLDSLAATELSRELGGQFDIELPSTLLFDHPTMNSVTSFILAKFQFNAVDSNIFETSPPYQQQKTQHPALHSLT